VHFTIPKWEAEVMKNYIGGVKVNQNIPRFERKCGKCKVVFLCDHECHIGVRIDDCEQCWCGVCAKHLEYNYSEEPAKCYSRFPEMRLK
jgi:hypothetical protein